MLCRVCPGTYGINYLMKKLLVLLTALVLSAVSSHTIVAKERDTEFRPFIAVKTNLVYWATALPDFNSYTFVPNLEAEYFFCDRWSVAGLGNYAKWGYGDGKFFGISFWSLEPRWWIWGDGRFNWIYIGIYGQMGDYDVQNGDGGQFGFTGPFWSAGLSFGVTVPFSDRFGVEVGLRAGYRQSEVNGYSYEAPEYFRDYTETDRHWGLTGLKVSFYYRFGKGSM